MIAATDTAKPIVDAVGPPIPAGLRVAICPDDVRNGLGKLVLTLVELIRQLLERQAIRRIDAGSLADDEIERLGTTFLQLGEQVTLLREQFGLDEDELNLDLGPLGRLL
ncbi:MAG TPA: gas vesicle protein K [Isosphaeraceae bacterium]|nr:gas vesicle protein K [Isosphaeraceae bacterium]